MSRISSIIWLSALLNVLYLFFLGVVSLSERDIIKKEGTMHDRSYAIPSPNKD